jgi:uncharacterized protein DUF3606
MKIDPVKPDRHVIDLSDKVVANQWAKHLGKSLAEIETAMNKVGPSCAAIRKELGIKEE